MDLVVELLEEFPCRNKQIEQLFDLIGGEVKVDSVFIYGSASVGKSAVLNSLLKKINCKKALINLIECYSQRLIFESILNQLSDHVIDPQTGIPYAKCDNLMEFLTQIQKLALERDLNGSVIVLDKAEKLRQMEFNLLPAFLRLQELSNLRISVVLVSEVPFENYYLKNNIVEPFKVFFPQYKKDELLEILAKDYEVVKNTEEFKSVNFDFQFYQNYLNVFLSVFYRACRDLSELRYMAKVNFGKYIQPCISGEKSVEDAMGLWRHIAPILKSSLEVLYLRTSADSNATKAGIHNLELPFYAKYLLIASYLASYNSVKDDKRIFMKFHGKKRKTAGDIKAKAKVAEKLNTQLGPKPFGLDRLLAIFYSILDEKIGFNNNLLVQLCSLVELQLLTAVSDSCSLDAQKYKCNVNYDFIQGVARMVGFNVRKYLSDFSHY